ncbi:hypothetical protein RSAG8_13622, partial [Rhizoctonia solani AG-8 WAC10335]
MAYQRPGAQGDQPGYYPNKQVPGHQMQAALATLWLPVASWALALWG